MPVETYRSKEYRAYQRQRSKRIRLEAIDLLGGVCQTCGFSDVRALQFDHINGGGSKDRVKSGNSSYVASLIIKNFPESKNKYQVLCANCNWIKRFVQKEHKQRIDD